MTRTVTVVDYGIGNLLSVTRAVERCGGKPVLSGDPKAVAAAETLILPGVGAFADGMAGLRQRDLVEAVHAFVATGRPMLGICLGMQMLLEESTEFGISDGLGSIGGRVTEIPGVGTDGAAHKVPHIGWAEIRPPEGRAADWWAGSILDGLEPGSAVYFVHSFTAWPSDEANRLADADYDGCRLSAAVRRDNVYGTQFHPEKSGPTGLRILDTFLGLD